MKKQRKINIFKLIINENNNEMYINEYKKK